MIWVNIVVAIILFFSFIGGLKEGAVKNFFSLLALIIAIPLAGLSYYLLAIILAFLPGTNWENFIGFFITLVIISIILHLIFFLPRKIVQKVWKKGTLHRLLGGALNLFNTSIGLVVFTLALQAYPISDWLARAIAGSSVLTWLVGFLSFVQTMLPEEFQNAAALMVSGSLM